MIKVKGIQNTMQELKKSLDAQTERGKISTINNLVLKLKEATPVDTGEARDGWMRKGNKIVNDVEHIAFLNQGSSMQAPSHFIEKALLVERGIKPSGIVVTET
jgi:hypothetical protein